MNYRDNSRFQPAANFETPYAIRKVFQINIQKETSELCPVLTE